MSSTAADAQHTIAAQPPVAGQRRDLAWWARCLALLPAAVVGVAIILTSRVESGGQRYFSLVDDALISMSYARTLVDTGEFVWFPGADRVEGITNPLHALTMTLPQLAGFDASTSVLAVSLMGLGWVLVAGFAAGVLAGRLGASGTAQVVTTATISLMWPLLFWSVFGLEVGTIAALALSVTALAAGLDRSSRPHVTLAGIALLSALGVWTRMDFLVSAAVVALWCVATAVPAQRVQRAAVLFGSLAGSLVLLFALRLGYYGEWLPNTYALKLTGTSAPDRVARAFGHVGSVWLFLGMLVLGAVVLWVRGSTTLRPVVILVAGLAAAQLAYAFYTGGDAFTPDRFFQPGITTTSVLAIAAADVGIRSWRRAKPSPSIASVAAGLASVAVALVVLVATSRDGYTNWRAAGTALPPFDAYVFANTMLLAEITSPDAVIAVYGAGATYWSQRPAIDLLGKNDPVIANAEKVRAEPFIPGHAKWDYMRSIVEQRPDVVAADLLRLSGSPADSFPATPAELEAIAQNYDTLCMAGVLPILVRKDTTAVDRTALSECPPIDVDAIEPW